MWVYSSYICVFVPIGLTVNPWVGPGFELPMWTQKMINSVYPNYSSGPTLIMTDRNIGTLTMTKTVPAGYFTVMEAQHYTGIRYSNLWKVISSNNQLFEEYLKAVLYQISLQIHMASLIVILFDVSL